MRLIILLLTYFRAIECFYDYNSKIKNELDDLEIKDVEED
jgi:hypothetical protein